mmetsp:Transcript_26794/g.75236  ORF Transcript_26794/g.75236 Transcript_26794/m.75236 type:complete len:225 (+) Transcript_26794:155-829(+)
MLDATRGALCCRATLERGRKCALEERHLRLQEVRQFIWGRLPQEPPICGGLSLRLRQHDDDRLPPARREAANTLLLEVPEICLEALELCRRDSQARWQVMLPEGHPLPPRLEPARQGFRPKVHEGVACTGGAVPVRRQVQEVKDAVKGPLAHQHLLRVVARDVADHQGRQRDDLRRGALPWLFITCDVVVRCVEAGRIRLARSNRRGWAMALGRGGRKRRPAAT